MKKNKINRALGEGTENYTESWLKKSKMGWDQLENVCLYWEMKLKWNIEKCEGMCFLHRSDISAKFKPDQNGDLQAESVESLFASCGSKFCCRDSNISAGILLLCPATQCSLQHASDTSRPQGMCCHQGINLAWYILSVRSFHFMQVSKLFSEYTMHHKLAFKPLITFKFTAVSCQERPLCPG